MTRLPLFFIGLAGLLLAACGTTQPAPTPTEIAQVQIADAPVLPTATATVLPVTNTAVPPTNTATLTQTNTPVPTLTATPQPTITSTNTPIPLPPPSGEIYFFLDPDPPSPDNESFDPRSYNFYRAKPGATANDWLVETILTDMNLEGPSITVSPDQTKLALLLLDDTDGDGKLVHNVGGDIRNIYIYDLITHSIGRLTNNTRSTLSVSWLPDSQAVTYPQSEKVFTIHLDNANPMLLFQLPENAHVAQLTWSPDSQELIFHANAQLTGLRVYEPDSDRVYPVYETVSGNVFFSEWSPDGRWLAFTHYGSHVYGNWRYVAAMNKESLEVTRLLFGEDYMSSPPDWSMDGQWLAFTINESSLSLWNSETLSVTDILSGANMSIPVWSSLENQMAVALGEDNTTRLFTLTPQAYSVTEIFSSESFHTIKPFAWSPDGEWLLIFAASEEQSGLYTVHVASGISYLVMDTTGGEPPWELVWLPTLQSASD